MIIKGYSRLLRIIQDYEISRVADSGLARRLAERVPELHTAPTPASLVWWGLDWLGGEGGNFYRVCYRKKRVWKPAIKS